MAKIAGLTGQYIQIKRSKNDVITYGGDQGFFAGAPADSVDEGKERMGCGIIALGDLILYLASGNPAYRFKENESYVNRILSEQEYKDYYNYMYDFMGGLPAKAGKGLNGIRLQRKFNRMARIRKWKLRARWGFGSRKLYSRMTEMLNRDIPVILSIPPILFKKDNGQGLGFYKKEENEYCRACAVTAHYVVVTGLLMENNSSYLIISSWGTKYYVDWNEYERFIHTHFMGTILGNILYIR